MIISFIPLGSTAAYNNIVNLAVSGLYASYFITSALLLWRRLQGIRTYDPKQAMVSSETLQWGPWKLPHALGVANNLFACVYLAVMCFFCFWPSSAQVTVQSMNFICVTFGGSVLFAVRWYFVRANKTYTGPVVEVVI